MDGFIYFLPGATQDVPALELVANWGLHYAFDDRRRPHKRAAVGIGPDKQNGVILGASPTVQVRPEHEWKPLVYRGDLPPAFLTFDEPPTPQVLERPITISEFSLPLGDGNKWKFPLIRNCDQATGDPLCLLPCTIEITDDGGCARGDVRAPYRELWQASEKPWNAMLSGEDIMTTREIVDFVLKIFQLNYRVGAAELNALGVFSEEMGPANIASLCIGWFSWQRWKETIENQDDKKKLSSESPLIPDSSILPAGNVDCTPAIAPPART